MTYDVILFTGITRATVKPFGAYKCAHELRQAGFTVLVINFYNHFELSELFKILDSAAGSNTLFVGFSNTFMSLRGFVQQSGFSHATRSIPRDKFLPYDDTDIAERAFVAYLKRINPEIKVVIGGTRTNDNLGYRLIDYAVVGYADASIVNLAQHLKDGTPLRHSQKILGSKTVVIKDPLADGFDFNASSMTWTLDDIVTPGEVLPIEISRGCVFKCAFCNYRFNGKETVDYIKPISTIKKELIHNYENYGITDYRILDDTFNDVEQKIDDMLEAVKDLPFKPRFWAYIRLDLLAKHPHTLTKLYDMGIRGMFFGIETLYLPAGRAIGKGFDPVKQVEMIQNIRKIYGNEIHLTGSFIVGLPHEPLSSVEATQARVLSGEIPLDDVQYCPLTFDKKEYFYWESAMSVDFKKYGYEPTEDSPAAEYIGWKNELMSWKDAVENSRSWAIQKPAADQPVWFNNENLGTPDENIQNYKKQVFDYLNVQP